MTATQSRPAPGIDAPYRELLDAAPDAMVVVNQRAEIVLLNLRAEKQFGYPRAELVGQPVKNIIPHGFAELVVADNARLATDLLAHEIGKGIELVALCKDGSEFPVEIMLSPLETDDGILVTASIRDISAARALALLLAHSAEHDFLTGLPNRMLLNDRIAQAILNANRHSNRAALLFLDLDGFKAINDSLGHAIGDKLLQSVAQCLLSCGRASDTVSRQGGDEFIVLLAEVQHPEDAAIAARRVLSSVAQEHSIDQHLLHVTTSIGVSVYPDDGTDAETLIKNADTAMYQAKEHGRHTYQYFKPVMNDRAIERQSIEEGLRGALELQQLELHYQPKISFKTGAITGAEALLRWTHPTRGPIPPVQFIPVAEDCGLILPIGKWVMRQACHQLRAWLDEGLPVATMAVNVSSIEFHGRRFLDELFAVLQEAHLDPAALELDLTEGALLKHAKSAMSILGGLRANGVQVALDDFGTGYSSLSYLQKFPVNAVKIDQSFVSKIIDAERDTTLVTAVISMAKHLGLRAIAEGVETRKQMAFLRAHKCDEAQGYYVSPPVPAPEFAKLMRAGRRKAFVGPDRGTSFIVEKLAAIAPLCVEGVNIRVIDDAVQFSGVVTPQDPCPAVSAFLSEVHRTVIAAGAHQLRVDITTLSFMNAAAIRLLADWVKWVLGEPRKKRYVLQFLANRDEVWQATTLAALQSFGGAQVSVNLEAR